MQSNLGVNRALSLITLLTLPFLVGSSCFFAFSSGGGSGGTIVKKDDDDDRKQETADVRTGSFGSPAAAGLNYHSPSRTGVTGRQGEFEYVEGERVQFALGDITLGAPVVARPSIAPTDLVAGTGTDATAARNITRLLHSLDAESGDDVITIPAAVRAKAVRSNASVSSAIEYLDFADETAFTNAASQLVAALTGDYAHTATLADGDSIESDAPDRDAPDRELEP